MSRIGFVFSGQGAQYIGMGQDLYKEYSEVKKAFDKAEDILGYSLKDICFNGPSDKLDRTDITQPAIFTLSVGIINILKNKGISAEATSGLSLGEYTSLYYSNIIDFESGLSLLKTRGEIMNGSYPEGKGAMTAVIGLDKEAIKECISEVKGFGIVEIANLNCPGQIVVTGETVAIEKIEPLFKERKAMKVVRLDVSGPFHSSLLKEASLKLKKELEKVKFNKANIPVFTNYTGKQLEEDNIVETLTGQMCSTVYFEENIRQMLEFGIDTFIEIGPGKALSGFVKRVNRKVKIMNIESIDTLDNVLNHFKI